jgi:xanthine dehydrogenase accessory factor
MRADATTATWTLSAGRPVALVKGAGDLATGVALRLHRAGFAVVMTEIPQPTAVRRTVAFAEAVYEGRVQVEGVDGVMTAGAGEVTQVIDRGGIPVVVDPTAVIRRALKPLLIVDAIVAKRNLGTRIGDAPAVIALGPGFVAGVDVHAVIETKRGHTLGRVIFHGAASLNTGIPGEVGGYQEDRILRSPAAGRFKAACEIGAQVFAGDIVGYVGDYPVRSAIGGVLRGLLRSGLEVTTGFKLGDVGPQATREQCFLVSDKALAIAGGVLEAACTLLGGVRFVKRVTTSSKAATKEACDEVLHHIDQRGPAGR